MTELIRSRNRRPPEAIDGLLLRISIINILSVVNETREMRGGESCLRIDPSGEAHRSHQGKIAEGGSKGRLRQEPRSFRFGRCTGRSEARLRGDRRDEVLCAVGDREVSTNFAAGVVYRVDINVGLALANELHDFRGICERSHGSDIPKVAAIRLGECRIHVEK